MSRPASSYPRSALLGVLLACSLLLACSGTRSAGAPRPEVVERGGTFRHPAGVTIEVPPGWKVSRTDETLSLLSPAEAVLMMFFVVEVRELDVALRAMDRTIAKYLDRAELGDRRQTEINGMKAIVADGVGVMDGERVDVGIALTLTPLGKVLIVLGLARDSAPPERQREVRRIIRSIAPASGSS